MKNDSESRSQPNNNNIQLSKIFHYFLSFFLRTDNDRSDIDLSKAKAQTTLNPLIKTKKSKPTNPFDDPNNYSTTAMYGKNPFDGFQ